MSEMNVKAVGHTAGPWIVYQPPGGALQIVPEDSGSLRICTVMQAHNEHANARLIAAAPELLEALRKAQSALLVAFNHITSDGMFDHPAQEVVSEAEMEARVAIAKATGRG